MSDLQIETLYQRIFSLEHLTRRMSLQIQSLRLEIKDLKDKLEEKENQDA